MNESIRGEIGNRFYLACFRDNVGTSVGFHCKDGRGYSTNIDQAHVYTLEEAQHHYNHARSYDLPLSVEHVDALAIWKVDCQYIPSQTQIIDGCTGYAVFRKGQWDGNDVFWLNKKTFGTSTDFENASYFTLDEVSDLSPQYVAIPYFMAENAKRRTFNFKSVDRRKMVQGAGLKMPEHLKKAKRKNPNPKTRFNCPECGKLSWQDNPYDFERCGCCGHVGGCA